MKKKKYYTVWEGKEPGIYSDWKDCERQVKGFEAARYKSFDSEAEAREAFLSPWTSFIKPRKASSQRAPKPAATGGLSSPLLESIAVDAACSGNPGVMEYRGVYTRTGEEIFHQGPFAAGSNNIGEFLALVHALAWLKQRNSSLTVYSDSVTALAWLRAGRAKTKLEATERNRPLFDLLSRAENWLKANRYNNPVLKWETTHWGEIPADFGRK